ncbi:anaerobic ribonucleoside-triphosphate reductase activating protein [Shewanella salipaludis]|uniref:Anaerobic ribonucleoside-triphosphate reductase activating protein n=1 Tax=Shewanella salipaludis TaxID=2723052 RepID=A0A972JJS9_9GAMM|nr:anaerobic ribonucleoside-triphosphate reductase activating protein [Shewanella salipaludis]NMH66443.1 anaerobic ribonucleoside-triphosphate reductase activating protein [Shewanella salipaludis]
MFNSLTPQIALQEVPGEVSLLFSITGCDVGCKGCHSVELWDANYGEPLTQDRYLAYLEQYLDFVSCIVFFGGEWQPGSLIPCLALARSMNFKTCLYTGRERVAAEIVAHLDYLKTGEFKQQLGGLASPGSNQKFYDLNRKQIINYKFIRE